VIPAIGIKGIFNGYMTADLLAEPIRLIYRDNAINFVRVMIAAGSAIGSFARKKELQHDFDRSVAMRDSEMQQLRSAVHAQVASQQQSAAIAPETNVAGSDVHKENGTQLELAKVPQILAILEQKTIITPEQKRAILDVLDNAKSSGKTAFAGEVGVELGFYDKATLDQCLTEQAALKAEAAVKDIQTISMHGKQSAPTWLQANWGNNGVNPSSPQATLAEGASAAANMAQNMVMIANQHPEIAAELVKIRVGFCPARTRHIARVFGSDSAKQNGE